jgi:broad specificity phosphatase PhoE
MLTRLFLIRHGRSVWNAEGRIQGHADPPLDDVGREQARRLAGRLQGGAMVALYTSPLQRARETADIIGQALGVPVVADERLKEYGIGVVTGLTFEQVAEQYPDVARRWTAAQEHLDIPGEEGSAQFRARVVAAFDDILARHADGPVGVVAHGGTFGDYLNHLIGLARRHSPFRFGNGSLTIVEVNPVRPRIVLLNDTCHLRGEP